MQSDLNKIALKTQLSCQHIGDVLVLKTHLSRLDGETANDFIHAATKSLLNTKKAVLNFACVLKMDAIGCGALVALLRKTNAAGTQIKLCDISPELTQNFEALGLHHIYDVYSNELQAVSSYLHT